MESAIDSVYQAAAELAELVRLVTAMPEPERAMTLNAPVYEDQETSRERSLTLADMKTVANVQELVSRWLRGTASPALLARFRQLVKRSDADSKERVGIFPLSRLERTSPRERGGGTPSLQFRKLVSEVEELAGQQASRRTVARHLGWALDSMYGSGQEQATSPTDRVLAAMPTRATKDNLRSAEADEPFIEDASMTVNAAYRAFGVPRDDVHQLASSSRQPPYRGKSSVR